MSYTPHTWVDNETITAAKLNNLEDGVQEAAQSGGGALIVNSSYSDDVSNYVLDKTAQEIYDALLAGTPVYIKYQSGILGESGTGSYISYLYLAPVVKIYGYSYTDNIRICASNQKDIGDKNNHSNMFSPSVLIYSATGLNQYPVYLDTIYVPSANVNGNGGIN